MPTAPVDGVELYYESHGEGRPLLLVPGLGADLRIFAWLTGDLSRRCRVVSFDPRGSGRSAKPDAPYSIETMADDAAGILGALDIERSAVMGYSMGGRIALALSLRHPGLVDRLVLAATSARTPERVTAWQRFVTEVLSRIPLPTSVDPQPRYAFERQRQASRQFDCSNRLGEIEVPTLVIHGRADRMVPLALARELHAGIAGSRLEVVPGGHGALLTFGRRRFAEELASFAGV